MAIKGLVTKIATTADQCVRLTIDIDSAGIPLDANLLLLKNEMVVILPEIGAENDFQNAPEGLQTARG